MSQPMTLELPDDLYESVKQAALAVGLQPAEWIVSNLHQHLSPLRPGSPLAILQALQDAPRVSSEDVDELERMIKDGELSVDWTPIFDEREEERP
jgi:hypothetical protein